MGDKISYVLVCDEDDGKGPWYYEGYYKNVEVFKIPQNTNQYINALKIQFKNEAQNLCDKINQSQQHFKYHVEEHMYLNN